MTTPTNPTKVLVNGPSLVGLIRPTPIDAGYPNFFGEQNPSRRAAARSVLMRQIVRNAMGHTADWFGGPLIDAAVLRLLEPELMAARARSPHLGSDERTEDLQKSDAAKLRRNAALDDCFRHGLREVFGYDLTRDTEKILSLVALHLRERTIAQALRDAGAEDGIESNLPTRPNTLYSAYTQRVADVVVRTCEDLDSTIGYSSTLVSVFDESIEVLMADVRARDRAHEYVSGLEFLGMVVTAGAAVEGPARSADVGSSSDSPNAQVWDLLLPERMAQVMARPDVDAVDVWTADDVRIAANNRNAALASYLIRCANAVLGDEIPESAMVAVQAAVVHLRERLVMEAARRVGFKAGQDSNQPEAPAMEPRHYVDDVSQLLVEVAGGDVIYDRLGGEEFPARLHFALASVSEGNGTLRSASVPGETRQQVGSEDTIGLSRFP